MSAHLRRISTAARRAREAMARRDEEIRAAVDAGERRIDIAEAASLSRQAVDLIVKRPSADRTPRW